MKLQVIENSYINVTGIPKNNSLSDRVCDTTKSIFKDPNDFGAKGGMKGMGGSLERGMVLVFSLWDDYDVNMQWLDGQYPPNKSENNSSNS